MSRWQSKKFHAALERVQSKIESVGDGAYCQFRSSETDKAVVLCRVARGDRNTHSRASNLRKGQTETYVMSLFMVCILYV
ncbi:hypothetical protein TorRG33x02_243410 [Trema orientale]|uniref:Uncharacterized protein n=1 Tax=Trema orientale TaxID=63057 RepID=A0A2P5DS90_TREOI|nr:hypothetical protein TorRG33x02_243410 [Trema orientale]